MGHAHTHIHTHTQLHVQELYGQKQFLKNQAHTNLWLA